MIIIGIYIVISMVFFIFFVDKNEFNNKKNISRELRSAMVISIIWPIWAGINIYYWLQDNF